MRSRIPWFVYAIPIGLAIFAWATFDNPSDKPHSPPEIETIGEWKTAYIHKDNIWQIIMPEMAETPSHRAFHKERDSALGNYFATQWIEGNYNRPVVIREISSDVSDFDAAENGDPFMIETTGQLREDEQFKSFHLSIEVEGIGLNRTVYRAIEWSIDP